ncbi:phage tail protein [Jiangella muralis]|uniref:phage tail protein n=1 Tax=Jiangella muralis TaxID=702383 RepID=UPI00069E4F4B|nr:phage tail protein [Jiangella muralis]
MTPPAVSEFTARLYADLPELYRDADAAQGTYPLLRYLSLLGDIAGDVDTLADRVDAGDLTDPAAADPAWLPWLAQLVGVRLRAGMTVQQQRDAISGGATGWQSGTRAAIAEAAQAALTGTRYVDVRPHAGPDPFALLILVRSDEAPSPMSLVADAVVAAGAKPAGYGLVVQSADIPWSAVDTAFPLWQDIDAQQTWAPIDSTGID